MNTNSAAPEGKRPFLGESSRETTRKVVNTMEARTPQAKGRAASRKLTVIDVVELQMAGFFIIPQQRRK